VARSFGVRTASSFEKDSYIKELQVELEILRFIFAASFSTVRRAHPLTFGADIYKLESLPKDQLLQYDKLPWMVQLNVQMDMRAKANV